MPFYPKTSGGTEERPFILSMCFMLGEGNTDGGLKHQPTTWISQAQLEAAERLLLTKGMSRVRLLYKAVSPLGLFSGVGLAPCPSPPSLWSYRALEEKSGWRALHGAFRRERSGNFADRSTGQHLPWDTKTWLYVVTKCLCPTDLLATTSDLVKPVPQSPLINGDLG